MNGDTTQSLTTSAEDMNERAAEPAPRPGRPERIESPPPTVPLRAGRYRLLHQIGAGGMGVVYAAIDTDLDRRVAIKMVRPSEGARLDQRRERLVREARALAKLDHPAIVTIHDVGLLETAVFIAMAYIDGLTLDAWVAARAHHWREIVALFVEIGEGLAAAHEVGLVHRDFKPSNVLIDGRGRPHIVDFGLAKQIDDADTLTDSKSSGIAASADHLTRDSQRLGTPGYMSPEQRVGVAVDARSDQYSYCLSLQEALTTARGRIPRALSAAIDRGIAQDRSQRWSSMHTLVRALARANERRRVFRYFALFLALVTTSLGLAFVGLERDGGVEPEPEPEHPPSHGPILHWSFDEGAGSSIHDIANPESTAVLMGGPRWTDEVAPIPAANPFALEFDGRDDEALLRGNLELANFDHDEDFTIALWIRPDPIQPDTKYSDNDIVDKWSGDGRYPFTIRYVNQTAPPEFVGKIKCARYDLPDNPQLTSKRRLDDGVFHHVACVKQGELLLLYVDGALNSTTLDTTGRSTRTLGPLSLGRRQISRNYFAGVMDDLFIYERALSAAEIDALRQRSE